MASSPKLPIAFDRVPVRPRHDGRTECQPRHQGHKVEEVEDHRFLFGRRELPPPSHGVARRATGRRYCELWEHSRAACPGDRRARMSRRTTEHRLSSPSMGEVGSG